MKKIFVINPGATSTKVSYFEDEQQVFGTELTYNIDDLKVFKTVFEQLDLRFKDIKNIINTHLTNISFDAVVGRGGLLPPVETGAIEVNDELIDCLKNRPVLEHASNLGAALANRVAKEFGSISAKSFIYDPVTVDQMDNIARISGSSLIERSSTGHALNMRAVARTIAKTLNKPYEESNIIVVHVGGGASASAHKKGRMIDVISDDEVMFSSERTGGIPLKQYIKLCYMYDKQTVTELTRKKGGLVSYFGTNDARKIHELMNNGDEKALLVLKAMAYQIAKAIGELATVLKGNVDATVLTGGIAHSSFIAEEVHERVKFIAPFFTVPGEKEMSALANGALRVLNGEETAQIFKEK
ncbi:butyrate kinase [Gemella sp. Musashino-2025]